MDKLDYFAAMVIGLLMGGLMAVLFILTASATPILYEDGSVGFSKPQYERIQGDVKSTYTLQPAINSRALETVKGIN